jgi:HPt (histidine-containing phosphotransfer) domain-containing protein
MSTETTMERGTAEASVDEERLAELFELLGAGPGAGGLAPALDLFVGSVPPRLAELAGAVATGRLHEAAAVAHSVRGSAGAFGAARLARLAAEVERGCGGAGPGRGSAGGPDADPAELAALVGSLETAFEDFREVLENRAGRVTNPDDAGPASETKGGGR